MKYATNSAQNIGKILNMNYCNLIFQKGSLNISQKAR
jgi:hypothetical protein